MAALRPKVPVGSAPWIVTERRQAGELVAQETEEFGFAVRNEIEWLNEHMAEIFAPGNLNVTNVFKTPGKLRGKTPRTARKRNANGNRAPLTDIFAPNSPAVLSPAKAQFFNKLQNANSENQYPAQNSATKAALPAPGNKKLHFDSGYHGATDDEMDIDRAAGIGASSNTQPFIRPKEKPTIPDVPSVMSPPVLERRSTTLSFVSAKENLGSSKTSQQSLIGDSQATVPDENMAMDVDEPIAPDTRPAEPTVVSSHVLGPQTADLADDNMDVDDIRSPSDGSSPIKPLLRKSSLTFSALPAREPLAKTSFGSRISHIDPSKSFGGNRASQFGRVTGGRVTGGAPLNSAVGDDDHMEIDTVPQPVIEREESESTKIHNKTSTQRLHDRINMLGQSREVRTSKSTHFNTSTDKLYPQLVTNDIDRVALDHARISAVPEPKKVAVEADNDDDDWIAPVKKSTGAGIEASRTNMFSSKAADFVDHVSNKLAGLDPPRTRHQSPYRSAMHKKMASTTVLESPTKAAMAPGNQKPISVSNPTPSLKSHDAPSTPTGSPPRSPSGRRLLDGPLSASKAKLYSVLKSAKGIFASSAGVSAQAKMEALSPPRMKRPQQANEHPTGPSGDIHPAPALGPTSYSARPESPLQEGRRTRSSSEREQRKKEEQRQRAANDLDKVREKERQKAAAAAHKMNRTAAHSKERLVQSRQGAPSRTETESSRGMQADSDDDMPPPPPPKSMLPTVQSQRMREPRRVPIARPPGQPQSKTKPAPVTVRMPSQRIGHVQPSNTALNHSLHDTLPPPPRTGLGMHANSSTTSVKSTTTSGKKALEAAAKKREQEAKAAQRKAEQKRELEHKRAAKQEAERRLEQQRKLAEQQRKLAEQKRAQDAKQAAQKHATEMKRIEQQRKETQRPDVREPTTLVNPFHQEKGAQPQRGDVGNARPLSRVNLVHDPPRPVVQINPSKPPKRALQLDEEEPQQRPGMQRNPPSFQQLDAKRRKTNEEDEEVQDQRRSVMAPPVRQSNIRKVNPKSVNWSNVSPKSAQEPTKFPHGYVPASQGGQHGNQSIFVKTVTAQHQLQHGKHGHTTEMAKYANGRIPFADTPNPPAGPSSHGGHTQHRTPGRSAQAQAKSSPHYPPSESIALPEIATDSEDEDSDNEFQAPNWTNSPALRELLTQQQLVDPAAIFGPIGPLQMEEVFKNSKDRLKKFRDRTSSANWGGADRLTEEERKKDRELRERLMDDGGWDYKNQRAGARD